LTAQVKVNLGTSGNAAHFRITGAGAASAPAFQTGSGISITSTTNQSGAFVSGASAANFDGFWYADEAFLVPVGATNVSLSFSALSGDDRVVLELNGAIVGNFALIQGSPNSYVGPGQMRLAEPSDASFVFTGTASGTLTGGF